MAHPRGTLGPLLARWFLRRRTTVLGLLVAGGALGGLTLIPFSAYLVETIQLAGVLGRPGGHHNRAGAAAGFRILAEWPGSDGVAA